MPVPAPVATLIPGPDLIPTNHDARDYLHGLVPLSALVAQHDVMSDVLTSGTPSDTPDEPVLLRICPNGLVGRYEVADGHHRVAAAIRRGDTHVLADIEVDFPDDEPYPGPYFNFAALRP